MPKITKIPLIFKSSADRLTISGISSQNPPLSEFPLVLLHFGQNPGLFVRIPTCFAPLDNKGGILTRDTSDWLSVFFLHTVFVTGADNPRSLQEIFLRF